MRRRKNAVMDPNFDVSDGTVTWGCLAHPCDDMYELLSVCPQHPALRHDKIIFEHISSDEEWPAACHHLTRHAPRSEGSRGICVYSNQIMFDLLCQRRPHSKFSKIRGARLIYLPGFIICNVSPHICMRMHRSSDRRIYSASWPAAVNSACVWQEERIDVQFAQMTTEFCCVRPRMCKSVS